MPGSASAKHRLAHRHSAMRPGVPSPRLWMITAALLAVIGLALGGAGTFALWAGNSTANAGTITAGSTGLTLNGVQSATLTDLNAGRLGPGTSIVAPVTATNTGTTPMTIAVTNSVVTSQTNALAAELTVTVVQVATTAACVPSVTGGTSGRIAGFTTASSSALAAGASMVFCLKLTLDLDAPATVQGGTTAFTLTATGTQVAP